MKKYTEWLNTELHRLDLVSVWPKPSTHKGGLGGIKGGITSCGGRAALNSVVVLEFGTYNGYSANRLSRVCRQVYGFDSWKGLPEDWKGVERKGHFALDSLPEVFDNVELIPGWFNQTLEPFLDSHPDIDVGLIHIDCDLYSSTRYVLDTLYARGIIRPGLKIIFNEVVNYRGFQDGEIRALYELVQEQGVKFRWLPLIGRVLDIASSQNQAWSSFKRARKHGYQQCASIEITE